MTGENASRLRGCIAHDRRVALCRTELLRLADGTYAVLLDNTVSQTVRQVAFYSPEEWQTRSATLTDCFTLFPSAGEMKASSVRRGVNAEVQL